MYNTFVRKKSGNVEPWNDEKILAAVTKSSNRVGIPLTDAQKKELLAKVHKTLSLNMDSFKQEDNRFIIPIAAVHIAVETGLDKVSKEVAASYRDYRNWVKREARMMEEVYSRGQAILNRGDSTNADAVDNGNADAALCSTQGAKIRDFLLTRQYEEYFLTKEENEAAADGYIYPHDKNLRKLTMNCCLFDVAKVLNGGFEMGNIWYNEPKTLDVAFDVIGDIVLSAASQQYGGFTVPEVDKILIPYAEKSYRLYIEEYRSVCEDAMGAFNEEQAESYAMAKVEKDMMQGFQGWEYKFNTVASSRGDYPFITVTAGLSTDKFGSLTTVCMLRVRAKGQGKKGHKKPVLFPKLVFLFDKNLHGPGKELEFVYDEAVKCSSIAMYPDYLSLTGEGYVPSMYKKYGAVISPMGCRAFLSPWYERGGAKPADENDKPVFVGRFNVGAISLNLPMILAKSRRECTDFFDELSYYLEMIRAIHKRTYEDLGNKKASINPLGFCEGGFYGGNLSLNDKIKPCLESATASFGITALNELQQLYNQKSLVEDGEFALVTMRFINEQVQRFKEEDGHLYAIYGTPAEKLCELQVTQFRKKFGIIENVSDRLYVSNSFHCHVSEDISPIEKQDLENRFWDLFNGGKIQYCRYHLPYNTQAIKSLVTRAMDLGLYEGVNMSLSYCDDCGYQELSMDVCPKCGSKNLTKIDRMNGYLAYSRVKGDTRLNKGKMAEIAERKSM